MIDYQTSFCFGSKGFFYVIGFIQLHKNAPEENVVSFWYENFESETYIF